MSPGSPGPTCCCSSGSSSSPLSPCLLSLSHTHTHAHTHTHTYACSLPVTPSLVPSNLARRCAPAAKCTEQQTFSCPHRHRGLPGLWERPSLWARCTHKHMHTHSLLCSHVILALSHTRESRKHTRWHVWTHIPTPARSHTLSHVRTSTHTPMYPWYMHVHPFQQPGWGGGNNNSREHSPRASYVPGTVLSAFHGFTPHCHPRR